MLPNLLDGTTISWLAHSQVGCYNTTQLIGATILNSNANQFVVVLTIKLDGAPEFNELKGITNHFSQRVYLIDDSQTFMT